MIDEHSKIEIPEEEKTEQFFENLRGYKPEDGDILQVVAKEQANSYFYFGKPLLSAASELSVNDFEKAYVKLIKAGEFYFALALCKILNYHQGLPFIYSVIGEKAEIYGTPEQVASCYQ